MALADGVAWVEACRSHVAVLSMTQVDSWQHLTLSLGSGHLWVSGVFGGPDAPIVFYKHRSGGSVSVVKLHSSNQSKSPTGTYPAVGYSLPWCAEDGGRLSRVLKGCLCAEAS